MAGTEPPTRVVSGKALNCAGCGAAYTLKGFANTRSVACEYCGSIFDTSTPEWQLIEKVERARREYALWPLGTQARFGGKRFDLVGWMKRAVVGMEQYSWEEHLFFNPYHGYRYLTFQDGHFTLVETLPGMPMTDGVRAAQWDGVDFKHFSSCEAVVKDVVGEFPWRVLRGERVRVHDYVAPPRALSCEMSGTEIVWSLATYMTPAEVFAAVKPPQRYAPPPKGVSPAQPNKFGHYRDWLPKAFGIAIALWFVFTFLYVSGCSRQRLIEANIPPRPKTAPPPTPANPGEPALPAEAPGVSIPLTLESSRDVANIEIVAYAAVDNSWAYGDAALIDTKNEHAYPFGIEVEYYHGVDGGESWSEGSQRTEVNLGDVPNGEYLLQVERAVDDPYGGPINIVVWRDVPLYRYPVFAFLLIALYPIYVFFRYRAIEGQRWSESDHAG